MGIRDVIGLIAACVSMPIIVLLWVLEACQEAKDAAKGEVDG